MLPLHDRAQAARGRLQFLCVCFLVSLQQFGASVLTGLVSVSWCHDSIIAESRPKQRTRYVTLRTLLTT